MACGCSFCDSRETYCLKFCSGCRLVFYCSESCQFNDWASHKAICERNRWCMPQEYRELVENFARKEKKLEIFCDVLDSENRVVSGFSDELIRSLDEAVETHSLKNPAMHKDRYRAITIGEVLQLCAAVWFSPSVWDSLFRVSKRLFLVASLFLPGMGRVCDWRQSEMVLARLSFGLTCEDVEDLKRRFLVSSQCCGLVYCFLSFVLKNYVVSEEFALRRNFFISCLTLGCSACQSIKCRMSGISDVRFTLGVGGDFYSSPTSLDAVKLLLLTSRV